jgi:hypothetical protein
VGPGADPLLLRRSDSAGTSLDHRGGQPSYYYYYYYYYIIEVKMGFYLVAVLLQ